MSSIIMSQVWKESDAKQTNLVAMLALADAANDEGYAVVKLAALAELCRCNERNATYVVQSLENSGDLYVHRGNGYKVHSQYLITLGNDVNSLSEKLVRYFDYLPVEAIQIAENCIEKGAKERTRVQATAPFQEPEKGAKERTRVQATAPFKPDKGASHCRQLTKLVVSSDDEINTELTNGNGLTEMSGSEAAEVTKGLLLSVGVSLLDAEDFQRTNDLQRVRQIVSYAHFNRSENGGKIQRVDDFVCWALRNPGKFTPPSIRPEFFETDFYLINRTSDEIEADRERLEKEQRQIAEIELEWAKREKEKANTTESIYVNCNSVWSAALQELQGALPASTYKSWVEGSKLEMSDSGEYVVLCADQYKLDWLRSRGAQLIKRALAKVTGSAVQLQFKENSELKAVV